MKWPSGRGNSTSGPLTGAFRGSRHTFSPQEARIPPSSGLSPTASICRCWIEQTEPRLLEESGLRSILLRRIPEETIGFARAGGDKAIMRDGPGAVVEVRIGPAELAVGVVAEVVAHWRRRLGLLRRTQQHCRTGQHNCEKDQYSRCPAEHPKIIRRVYVANECRAILLQVYRPR